MYNEVYNCEKDIWSLIDPLECNERMLENLFPFYGIGHDKVLMDDTDFRKRWLAFRMI
jgi:hypothetical protein